MIQDYDRPVKGYKTSEMYDHPATVLYDNFAPAEEVFVETATLEVPLTEEVIIPEEEIIEDINEVIEEPITEEVIEEKEGE